MVFLRFPKSVTAMFFILFACSIIGNLHVPRGDVIDNALPWNDQFAEWNRNAENEEGYNNSDINSIIVRGDAAKPEVQRHIFQISEDLRQRGKTVISLASVPDFRDDGQQLFSTPYISPATLANTQIEILQSRIREDESVYRFLVSKNWNWTAIGIIPPVHHDKMKEAEELVEYVEGHALSPWDRIFKTDIRPRMENALVCGFGIVRWLIDKCLNRDVIISIIIGLGIAFLGFMGLSPRQAIIATFISTLAGLTITRALVIPMSWLVPGFCETVFMLLTYVSVIVQGTSFPLHKFADFREAEGTALDRFSHSHGGNVKIFTIAMGAVCAFAMLWWFPVTQVRHMALLSIVSVGVELALVMICVPALYLTVEQFLGREKPVRLEPIGQRWNTAMLARLGLNPYVGIAVSLVACIAGAVLFLTGKIPAVTAPPAYIRGTIVSEAVEFLGIDSANAQLAVHVQETFPGKKNALSNFEFVRAVWQFQQDLKAEAAHVKIGGVGSILDKIAQIVRESLQLPFPDSQESLDYAVVAIKSNLQPALKAWLYSNTSIKVIVSTDMRRSDDVRALNSRILKIAEQRYPLIHAKPTGMLGMFPQIDYYIAGGVGWNIAASYLVLFTLYAGCIMAANRRLRHTGYSIYVGRGAFFLTLPFLLGVGILAIYMWARGVFLSMATVPIGDLAINAGSDFALCIAVAYFYALAKKDYNPAEALRFAVATAGIVVSIDCLLNMGAFFPLVFSHFEPVRELGIMMILMLGVCGAGALFIVPQTLLWAVKVPLGIPAQELHN